MNKICKHQNYKIIQREETYPCYGVPTTIIANVKVCNDCGEDVFDFKLDDDNLKRAFEKYREEHYLIS
jgi:YgiT-type zinc finger domain-containing protein